MKHLPPELIDGVLKYLKHKDVAICYNTNNLFHVLIQKEIYRRLLPFYSNPNRSGHKSTAAKVMLQYLDVNLVDKLLEKTMTLICDINQDTKLVHCDECGNIYRDNTFECIRCNTFYCPNCLEDWKELFNRNVKHHHYFNIQDKYDLINRSIIGCVNCVKPIDLNRCVVCSSKDLVDCVYHEEYNKVYCSRCIQHIVDCMYQLNANRVNKSEYAIKREHYSLLEIIRNK